MKLGPVVASLLIFSGPLEVAAAPTIAQAEQSYLQAGRDLREAFLSGRDLDPYIRALEGIEDPSNRLQYRIRALAEIAGRARAVQQSTAGTPADQYLIHQEINYVCPQFAAFLGDDRSCVPRALERYKNRAPSMPGQADADASAQAAVYQQLLSNKTLTPGLHEEIQAKLEAMRRALEAGAPPAETGSPVGLPGPVLTTAQREAELTRIARDREARLCAMAPQSGPCADARRDALLQARHEPAVADLGDKIRRIEGARQNAEAACAQGPEGGACQGAIYAWLWRYLAATPAAVNESTSRGDEAVLNSGSFACDATVVCGAVAGVGRFAFDPSWGSAGAMVLGVLPGARVMREGTLTLRESLAVAKTEGRLDRLIVAEEARFKALDGLEGEALHQRIEQMYPGRYMQGLDEYNAYLRRKQWRIEAGGRPIPGDAGGPRWTEVDQMMGSPQLPPSGAKGTVVGEGADRRTLFSERDGNFGIVNAYGPQLERLGALPYTLSEEGRVIHIGHMYVDSSARSAVVAGTRTPGLGTPLVAELVRNNPAARSVKAALTEDNGRAFQEVFARGGDYFAAIRNTPIYRALSRQGFTEIKPPPAGWEESPFVPFEVSRL